MSVFALLADGIEAILWAYTPFILVLLFAKSRLEADMSPLSSHNAIWDVDLCVCVKRIRSIYLALTLSVCFGFNRSSAVVMYFKGNLFVLERSIHKKTASAAASSLLQKNYINLTRDCKQENIINKLNTKLNWIKWMGWIFNDPWGGYNDGNNNIQQIKHIDFFFFSSRDSPGKVDTTWNPFNDKLSHLPQ